MTPQTSERLGRCSSPEALRPAQDTAGCRPCPRCGQPPARVYEPKVYDGKRQHQAYCATCQRTYSVHGRDRPLRPAPLRAIPTPRLLISEHTLADVYADPAPWRDPSGERRSHLSALVQERDGHRCQLRLDQCAHPHGEVVVTRINPAGDFHPANLTTVCRACLRVTGYHHVCDRCGSSDTRPARLPVTPPPPPPLARRLTGPPWGAA